MESSTNNVELEWSDSTNISWAQKDTDCIANRDLVQSMYDVLLQNKEIRAIPSCTGNFNDVQALPAFQYDVPAAWELEAFLNTLLTSQVSFV